MQKYLSLKKNWQYSFFFKPKFLQSNRVINSKAFLMSNFFKTKKKYYFSLNFWKKNFFKDYFLSENNQMTTWQLSLFKFSMTTLVRFYTHLGGNSFSKNPFWSKFLLGEYKKISIINLNWTYLLFKKQCLILIKLDKFFLNFFKFCFFDEYLSPTNLKKFFSLPLNLNFSPHYYLTEWRAGLLTNTEIRALYSPFSAKVGGFPLLFIFTFINNKQYLDIISEWVKFNIPILGLINTRSSEKFINYYALSNTDNLQTRRFYLIIFLQLIKKLKLIKKINFTNKLKLIFLKFFKKFNSYTSFNYQTDNQIWIKKNLHWSRRRSLPLSPFIIKHKKSKILKTLYPYINDLFRISMFRQSKYLDFKEATKFLTWEFIFKKIIKRYSLYASLKVKKRLNRFCYIYLTHINPNLKQPLIFGFRKSPKLTQKSFFNNKFYKLTYWKLIKNNIFRLHLLIKLLKKKKKIFKRTPYFKFYKLRKNLRHNIYEFNYFSNYYLLNLLFKLPNLNNIFFFKYPRFQQHFINLNNSQSFLNKNNNFLSLINMNNLQFYSSLILKKTLFKHNLYKINKKKLSFFKFKNLFLKNNSPTLATTKQQENHSFTFYKLAIKTFSSLTKKLIVWTSYKTLKSYQFSYKLLYFLTYYIKPLISKLYSKTYYNKFYHSLFLQLQNFSYSTLNLGLQKNILWHSSKKINYKKTKKYSLILANSISIKLNCRRIFRPNKKIKFQKFKKKLNFFLNKNSIRLTFCPKKIDKKNKFFTQQKKQFMKAILPYLKNEKKK